MTSSTNLNLSQDPIFSNLINTTDKDLLRTPLKQDLTTLFKEDIIYLQGVQIPDGRMNDLFSKAKSLWYRYNTDSRGDVVYPSTSFWKSQIFFPLAYNALRTENMKEMAFLFCWIHTCRYAFGFVPGQCGYLPDLNNLVELAEIKLSSLISGNINNLVELFELLDTMILTKNDATDRIGAYEFSLFLCKQYYRNQLVTLNDLTSFCKKEFTNLIIPKGHSSEFFLSSLITLKAEKLFNEASPNDRRSFYQAFRTFSFLFKSSVGITFSQFWFQTNEINFAQNIGHLAYRLNSDCMGLVKS